MLKERVIPSLVGNNKDLFDRIFHKKFHHCATEQKIIRKGGIELMENCLLSQFAGLTLGLSFLKAVN